MNAASQWRLGVALIAATPYCTDLSVVAVAVTGSVSRGWSDRYSDIELAVFWGEVPPPEARRLPGATRWRDRGQDPDIGCWSEECEVHGVKLDIQHWAVRDAERVLADVLECFDVSPAKQAFAAAMRDAIPLTGTHRFEDWRQRLASYPDGLVVAMVTGHLRFGPHAWVAMLAERDDVLALSEVRSTAARNVLGCLLGLNRLYHPGIKWLWRTVESMAVHPPEVATRLRSVLVGEPASAVDALTGLIDDTLTLVERHLPTVDTAPTRARLIQSRPVWDAPPPGLPPV